jgi:hypothetical protein
MPHPEPAPAVVIKAVESYLALAYDGPPPVVVQSQLRMMRSAGADLYKSAVVMRDLAVPPTRYSIRLGNRHYPHMKLTVELAPDDRSWLFRADTHDRHVCPPENSPEHASFVSLMEKNQKLSEAIEAAWAQQGLPTFKTYLRDDLAQRQAAQAK